MNPVIVIETPSELDSLVQELASVRHIAIDTESNSFYAYFERVCLIQISTDSNDYIVDPIVLKDLRVLGEVLADPAVEKIFHAASNDVLGLKRDFQFTIRNIFDTAMACKLLDYQQLGLARILERHFDVVLNKKWQRHDWAKRPLKQEQLNYARLDTHYLIPLRHQLAEELKTRSLWEIAVQQFQKGCEQEFHRKHFHPEAFIQLAGARTLDNTGRRILQALYLFREHEARRRNRAPFRILSNETLVRLARLRPKDVRDFSRIKGMPRSYLRSNTANNLLDLIRKSEGFCEEHTLES